MDAQIRIKTPVCKTTTNGMMKNKLGRDKHSRHVGNRRVGIGSRGVADSDSCSLARNLACCIWSLTTNRENAIHQITSKIKMMLKMCMVCGRRLTTRLRHGAPEVMSMKQERDRAVA